MNSEVVFDIFQLCTRVICYSVAIPSTNLKMVIVDLVQCIVFRVSGTLITVYKASTLQQQ